MKNKKLIAISLGTILLLVLMLVIARPSEVWSGMKKIGHRYILLIIALYLLNLMTKALRWKVVMGAVGERIKYATILPVFVLGMAINNVTPGRIAGDPVRALIIQRKKNLDLGKCIAAVFVEKALDLIFLIILSLAGFIILIPMLTTKYRIQISLALGILSVALVMVFVLLLNPSLVRRMGDLFLSKRFGPLRRKGIENLVEKGCGLASKLNEGLRTIMKSHLRGSISGCITMVIWANEAFRLYLIMRALGEDVSLGGVLLVSNIATLVGMAVPWGAGNAATITALFSSMGTSVEYAATAGFLAIITSIWLSVPLGALVLLGTGTRSVRDALEQNRNISKKGTDTTKKSSAPELPEKE